MDTSINNGNTNGMIHLLFSCRMAVSYALIQHLKVTQFKALLVHVHDKST